MCMAANCVDAAAPVVSDAAGSNPVVDQSVAWLLIQSKNEATPTTVGSGTDQPHQTSKHGMQMLLRV
jgi:hypothetical protein